MCLRIMKMQTVHSELMYHACAGMQASMCKHELLQGGMDHVVSLQENMNQIVRHCLWNPHVMHACETHMSCVRHCTRHAHETRVPCMSDGIVHDHCGTFLATKQCSHKHMLNPDVWRLPAVTLKAGTRQLLHFMQTPRIQVCHRTWARIGMVDTDMDCCSDSWDSS